MNHVLGPSSVTHSALYTVTVTHSSLRIVSCALAWVRLARSVLNYQVIASLHILLYTHSSLQIFSCALAWYVSHPHGSALFGLSSFTHSALYTFIVAHPSLHIHRYKLFRVHSHGMRLAHSFLNYQILALFHILLYTYTFIFTPIFSLSNFSRKFFLVPRIIIYCK